MPYKLVSTILFSGSFEECKCEIYEKKTKEGPEFKAAIYLCREVIMMLKEGPVSMRSSDAPNSRPVKTWIQAKVINGLNGTSLKEIETEVEEVCDREISFITASLDSSYGF